MEFASTDDAAYRRACAAVSARIHHLAATTLSKIGEADLAWIAAEGSTVGCPLKIEEPVCSRCVLLRLDV
jgi:hypothetical protein